MKARRLFRRRHLHHQSRDRPLIPAVPEGCPRRREAGAGQVIRPRSDSQNDGIRRLPGTTFQPRRSCHQQTDEHGRFPPCGQNDRDPVSRLWKGGRGRLPLSKGLGCHRSRTSGEELPPLLRLKEGVDLRCPRWQREKGGLLHLQWQSGKDGLRRRWKRNDGLLRWRTRGSVHRWTRGKGDLLLRMLLGRGRDRRPHRMRGGGGLLLCSGANDLPRSHLSQESARCLQSRPVRDIAWIQRMRNNREGRRRADVKGVRFPSAELHGRIPRERDLHQLLHLLEMISVHDLRHRKRRSGKSQAPCRRSRLRVGGRHDTTLPPSPITSRLCRHLRQRGKPLLRLWKGSEGDLLLRWPLRRWLLSLRFRQKSGKRSRARSVPSLRHQNRHRKETFHLRRLLENWARCLLALIGRSCQWPRRRSDPSRHQHPRTGVRRAQRGPSRKVGDPRIKKGLRYVSLNCISVYYKLTGAFILSRIFL